MKTFGAITVKVKVAPWLQGWLSAYVERCKAADRTPSLPLMRCIARAATEVR